MRIIDQKDKEIIELKDKIKSLKMGNAACNNMSFRGKTFESLNKDELKDLCEYLFETAKYTDLTLNRIILGR